MANITINGQSITVSNVRAGGNISITNGRVVIDGVTIASDLSGIVEVRWEGPLMNLRSDASVTCGLVSGSVDAGSSVTCGSVGGNVDAGSSVSVSGSVEGDIDAGSSVSVGGKVGGSIDAGGSVRTG